MRRYAHQKLLDNASYLVIFDDASGFVLVFEVKRLSRPCATEQFLREYRSRRKLLYRNMRPYRCWSQTRAQGR
jgi:hypothetical protein